MKLKNFRKKHVLPCNTTGDKKITSYTCSHPREMLYCKESSVCPVWGLVSWWQHCRQWHWKRSRLVLSFLPSICWKQFQSLFVYTHIKAKSGAVLLVKAFMWEYARLATCRFFSVWRARARVITRLMLGFVSKITIHESMRSSGWRSLFRKICRTTFWTWSTK